MKRLMIALLGLTLAIGVVTPTFAQDQPKTEKKKKMKKMKKKKPPQEEKK